MLALAAVVLWSLAEGFLLFIVADVPISFVALRYGVRRGAVAALIAAPAAALGGLAMMAWTTADPDGARAALIALPAIDAALVDDIAGQWGRGNHGAMLAGAFQGIPYKLFAHSAALAGQSSYAGFFIGSVAARLPRFLLIAVITGLIGRWLRPRLRLRWRIAVLAACWTAFYAWYFSVMPA